MINFYNSQTVRRTFILNGRNSVKALKFEPVAIKVQINNSAYFSEQGMSSDLISSRKNKARERKKHWEHIITAL